MRVLKDSSFDPFEEFLEYVAYFNTPYLGAWPAAGRKPKAAERGSDRFRAEAVGEPEAEEWEIQNAI